MRTQWNTHYFGKPFVNGNNNENARKPANAPSSGLRLEFTKYGTAGSDPEAL